jgi:hypothetical protein
MCINLWFGGNNLYIIGVKGVKFSLEIDDNHKYKSLCCVFSFINNYYKHWKFLMLLDYICCNYTILIN